MLRPLTVIGLAVALGAAAPASAQVAAATPATVGLPLPLAEAQRLLDQAQISVQAGKAAELGPQIAALESVLANPDTPKTIGGQPIFLVNGLTDRLLVQMWLTTPPGKDAAARSPRLINDPYPQIAYILGFYYNEIGQPDQALRALNAGVEALKKHMEPNLADTAPLLQGEIAAAHNVARRWQQAYDTYKAALSLPGKGFQGQMYRGMGFSLVEMNRLDEAQAAYEQSLKVEPDNALAKRELAYIAQLRGGGAQQAPTLFKTVPTPPAQ